MNAAEFLKLIEAHPLPWCHTTSETDGQSLYFEERGSKPFCTSAEAQGLADAAPAMAAAILRLLAAQRAADDAGDGPVPYEVLREQIMALHALRDSMPEELRQ